MIKKNPKTILAASIVAFIFLSLLLFFAAPSYLYPRMNRVLQAGPYKVSEKTQKFFESAKFSDLHQDILLWNKDLLERSQIGHLDLPRLEQGHIGFQIFSVVTSVPPGASYKPNTRTIDEATPLVMAQRWPPATWTSFFERARYQALKLQEFAKNSHERLTLLKSSQDLQNHFKKPQSVGAMLALEGLFPLEQNWPVQLQQIIDLGFRVFGLVHLTDTRFGSSSTGEAKGTSEEGLTPLGRDLILKLKEQNMVIDLAHASPKLIDDVLKISGLHLIVSHTGVQKICPTPRNLSDDQLRALGQSQTLIGIGYWQEILCGREPSRIAESIKQAVEMAGIDHVTLGSDFEGAVSTVFDVTGTPLLVEELFKIGFTEEEIQKIIWKNSEKFWTSLNWNFN